MFKYARHPLIERPHTTSGYSSQQQRRKASATKRVESTKSSQRSNTLKRKTIDEMLQAFSKRFNVEQTAMPVENTLPVKSPERTLRIEKEKQIGILLTQLSKKFPISDVLEKKNMDELDEELAYQIKQRGPDPYTQLRHFTVQGLPFSKDENKAASPSKHTVAEQSLMISDAILSRNPNIMQEYSSKLNQMPQQEETVTKDSRIFGKLKHREQKLPSTTLDKDSAWQTMMKKHQQPKSITLQSFLNPTKLKFFKSSSYNQTAKPAVNIDAYLKDQTVLLAQDQHTLAYYQGSFGGLEEDHHQLNRYSDKRMPFRESSSILRNNPDECYIQRLADISRRDVSQGDKVSASFIFNDEELPKQPTFDKEDGSLVYYNNRNENPQNNSVNIKVSQTGALLRKSSNNPDLRQYLPNGALSGVLIRPQFRAKSQAGNRTKSSTNRALIDLTPVNKSNQQPLPALTDFVKMPKRLLPKNVARPLDQATSTLYNFCPQAATLDKELENRVSLNSIRKSLLNLQKSPIVTIKHHKNINIRISEHKAPSSAANSIQNQPLRRDFTMIGESGVSQHSITIDPAKVRDAMDKIHAITNNEVRLETAHKPIKYDYIDPTKMNIINRKQVRRISRRQSDDDEDYEFK